MKEIYDGLKKCAAEGKDSVLVRIVKKTGSTPRGEDAAMLVMPDGSTTGTVGGGELEHSAAAQAKKLLESRENLTKTYAFELGTDWRSSTVLGGTATLSFRFVPPGDSDVLNWCAEQISESRVILFGAGHVAQALVPVLSSVGFDCMVYDDREQLLSRDIFPSALSLTKCDLETVTVEAGADDYVVIMTHGHSYDYLLLRSALKTEAKYIGVLGSRRKAAFANEKLAAEEFPEATIARTHCPIGISIGGKTPAEMAVSIAAEMIAVRAGKTDM